MTPDINNIFTQSSCLTSREIEQYVSGTLNKKDVRRVELHLAECSMCNDELDGYILLKDKKSLPKIISDINNKIDEKIFGSNLIPLNSSRKKINKRIFSIAASLILLVGVGFIINFYMNKSDKNLADTSAVEKGLNEDALVNKSVQKENIVSDVKKTDVSKKNHQITDTKTINPEVSEEQKDKNANLDLVNGKNKEDRAVSENTIKQDQDVDEVVTGEVVSDNQIIDDISTESISSEEKKSENNDIVIASTAKENRTKSDNKQPAENIAFMTTRGTNIKYKKSVNNKEIEKYKSLRESALLSYSMKIWDEALKDFNGYLKYKPNDYEIIYKSGISYYNLKNYNKAVTRFDKVIHEGINRYVENAEWYEAKSLIKLGKNPEAKILLNKIIVKDGKYQNQALDLLNSLE